MNRLLTAALCVGLVACPGLTESVPSVQASASILDPADLHAAQGLPDKVQLDDNTGDVSKGGVDVKRLSLTGDGVNLVITVDVEGDLVSTFKKRPASRVLTLNLDTDLKEATGGKVTLADFKEKAGFEYQVLVRVCLVYEINPGHETVACSGGFGGEAPKVPRSGVDVNKFDGAGKYSTTETASSLHLPKGPITATRIEAMVPYKQIGCAPGQGIRLLAREQDDSEIGGGYLPEARLRLK